MMRDSSSPTGLPALEANTSASERGWLALMMQGGLTVLLASLLSLTWSTGDSWDQRVDQPLYFLLMGTVVLALLAGFHERIKPKPAVFTSQLLLLLALWLLAKLTLLLTLNTDPQVLLREMSESTIWLPTLLGWSVLIGPYAPSANALSAKAAHWPTRVLALLIAIVLLGGALWSTRPGWSPEVSTSLAQLLLTSILAFLGMQYFGARMHWLRFEEGEREVLRRMAYQDLLTGLHNRRSLEAELGRLTVAGSPACALLFIDVDSFKLINDTLGHDQGDQVLQAVAHTLNTLSTESQAFRLSGDEFVLLLPGAGGEEASEVAQTLQGSAATRASRDLNLSISLSIGISCFPNDGTTPQELLRHADSAMYAVKREGRGQVRPYQAEQDQSTERIQHIARAIGQSFQLEQSGFSLLYQPIFNLQTGQIVKAEALLRWQHADLGQLSPAEFVPVAEQLGQMPRLGLWVLEEACREAAGWPPGLRVSVNVSAHQLSRSNFAAQVRDVLARTGLSNSALELELTETAQLYGNQRVEETLAALDQLGVRLCIDDFGAGYANLTRLRSLHLSGVKLDRSLIQHLPSGDEFSHLMTEALSALAYHYSLDLTAEGLETQRHVELAQEMGCLLGQGFALSLPLTPAELLALLEQPPRPLAARFPPPGAS